MDCLQLGAIQGRGKEVVHWGRGVRGAGDCPAKLSKKKERCARAEQRKETEVALRPLGNGIKGQQGGAGVVVWSAAVRVVASSFVCIVYACFMFHVLRTLSRLATGLGGVPDNFGLSERRCHNSMGGLINSAQVLTKAAKSKQCCSFLIEQES